MSNQPPIGVPQGAIRLNTDSQKLEFYAQDQWFEMATDVPTLDGGSRGVYSGGDPGSGHTDVIQFLTIPVQGNTIDFGDLTQSRRGCKSCGSRTRGLTMSGAGPVPRSDVIDFITMSSTGDATDFGNLQSAQALVCVSNQTRAFALGGDTPAIQNQMQFVTIASTGEDMKDAGDLTEQSSGGSAFGSPTRGFLAGFASPTNTNIDFFNFGSTGNAHDFGTLQTASNSGDALSSTTRGLVLGGIGSPNPYLSRIESITMTTLGNGVEFGDLTAGRSMFGATSDCVRGVMIGGYISPGANTNVIDYVNIATTGNAADFGDQVTTARNAGATSTAHGGL